MNTQIVTPLEDGVNPTGVQHLPHVERVTPLYAAELLKLNHSNRRIREAVVDRYVRDMLAGRWMFNGAPIIVSESNVLLDGQHRLTALVQAGVTLDFVMIYNAPDGVRYTVDQGTARTPGDTLTFAGYKGDSSWLAAIARMVMSREAGFTSIGGFRPSNMAIKEWVDSHPAAIEAVDVYRQAVRQVPANPTVVSTAWYLCSRIDREWADDFYIRRFINVEGLAVGDPVRALRRRLNEMRSGESSSIKGEQLRYVLLAWNADREGKRLSKLQGPKGGWTRHNFPEPK